MCLNPINAELQEFGRPKFCHEGSIKIPCGRCSECKSARAIEWATRARHEIALHNENCFLTLTYKDENLPSHKDIKEPFQKFMKRLRKHTKLPLRYMVSHEYGSQFFRPHHHAIIFGWNPKEQYEPKKTKSGETIFRSKDLEKIWTEGHSSVGTANEKTAYYIASYSLKGSKHEITLPNGEMEIITDRFDSSKRPSIGLNYLIKNQEQILNSQEKLPRYYSKLFLEKEELMNLKSPNQRQITRLRKLKELNPSLHEHYQNQKQLLISNRSSSELYAKYTLDQQKINSTDNEFRSTHEDSLKENYYKIDLKTNRDEYHRLTKGK